MTESKFEAHEYEIGEHLLPALINGDFTGLSDADAREFDVWETNARTAAGGIGHWTTIDGRADAFGRCDVTGLRGATERVAYMAKTGA